MNSPRPRPHPSPHAWNGRALVWAAAVACVSAAVGCAQAPVAAPTADAAGPATDTAAATEAGSLDAAADAFPASASAQAVDLAAIVLVAKLRTASNAAAQAKWPGPAPAIWPGWALHKLPLYLVAVDAKQKPVRGFLVGVAPLPAGAVAVPAQASVAVPAELTVARWDAGLKDIGPGEEMSPLVTAGGIDLLLATYTAERLADAALWATGLGRAAMLRLHADAAWQQVQGCGQNSYPRYEEAIALQLLECAVLQEAVQAADSAGAEARLGEWYAVRRRAIEVTVLVAKRWRHYDVQFGTATYAGQRLIAAAGLRTPAQHVAAHVAALQVLLDAKPTEFDSVSLGYSAPGAAALEVATRLGWEVEPAYRATDAVYHVLPAKLGEPPASLVDVAKGRHPWAKFAATAADVMKVPEEGGMP